MVCKTVPETDDEVALENLDQLNVQQLIKYNGPNYRIMYSAGDRIGECLQTKSQFAILASPDFSKYDSNYTKYNFFSLRTKTPFSLCFILLSIRDRIFKSNIYIYTSCNYNCTRCNLGQYCPIDKEGQKWACSDLHF